MMPKIGDRVKILKGVLSTGKFGVVVNVDGSKFSCLYVVPDGEKFGDQLTPDEVEIVQLTPYEVEIVQPEPVSETMNDADLDQIVDDVMGHKGDYVAGVEALAALYRGERDQIKPEPVSETVPVILVKAALELWGFEMNQPPRLWLLERSEMQELHDKLVELGELDPEPGFEKEPNPIDLFPLGDWYEAVANKETYHGYTAWQDAKFTQWKEDNQK